MTALAAPPAAAATAGSSETGTQITPAASTSGHSVQGAEKAMLLLLSLDEDVATRVLTHLTEAEVVSLRRATETVREVPAEVLAAIHREFLTRVRAGLPASLNGSGAYLRRLAGNALGEGKAAEIWRDRRPDDGASALAQLDSAMLAALLDAEHAQMIAVVLSQLDVPKAAEVLSKMPAARRGDVLQRIHALESVPETVLEAIEREFAGHLSRLGGERAKKVGGKEAAAGILKRLPQEDAQAILDAVAATSQETADALKQALFTFEDLLRVDGRGMQQLLKEVPTDQLVLALKTASEELREKVFGNLSSRAADMLREDLSLLGAVRVSDVEAAQRAIVEIALQLEQEGRITIAREGGGDYV